MKAVKQVMLLQSRLETLDERISNLAHDVDGLADLVGSLRDRLARLEGFIEGAAAAATPRPRLPRK
jgi:hypothetical protein